MRKPICEIAAVHDLSGYGRASLTVAIPILSVMGMQVSPLPTSILSTQTSGFKNYSFFDFTPHMQNIIDHWKKEHIKFDAIYTGFLGSSLQIDIINRFIDSFMHDDLFVIVDPVLGDEGKLYDTIDRDIVEGMKHLVKKANLITPNITEASSLLGVDNFDTFTLEKLKNVLQKLSDMGPETVVITSVMVENESAPIVAAYDAKNEQFWKIKSDYIPTYYPGTGDIFASILTGSLLRGDSLPVAASTAVEFISAAIKETYGHNTPCRNGIMFEKALPLLCNTPLTGALKFSQF